MEIDHPSLILIVDDNRNNLRVIFNFLKESDFRVLVAANGQDALRKLEKVVPDLILLDIMMPVIDGFEVCRRLKNNPATQEIPVIFMTALSEVADKVQGLALGAVDYITKPIQQEELLSRVRLHLRLRSLTVTLQEKNLHLSQEITARKAAEVNLHKLNQELEKRVIYRTQELENALRELQIREEKLSYDASHDLLTGLFNRAWLMEYLVEILSTAKNNPERNHTVLFLDLDGFKSINDRLGHLVGDQLLRWVSERLQICIGAQGKIARLGGDEFLILLAIDQQTTTIEMMADFILAQLQQPFKIGNYQLVVNASIGVIKSITDYEEPTTILRDADIVMYQAKKAGKGCYAILTPEIQSQALERMQLETELIQGLEKEEFCLYYQPIFSLKTEHPIGFEALIRWQHPQRGFLLPGKFITIAEEIELIQYIDLFALKLACQQLELWTKQFRIDFPLVMNVNFSAQQLQHQDAAEQIKLIYSQTNLSPALLKLEITESAFLDTGKTTMQILEDIQALGIQLCIDDFGTGYSSLSRLHTFPVKTIKVDRSFISMLDSTVGGVPIVSTIISLAKNLQMDAVAEGIETQAQLEKLKQLGCEFGQGYLFSHPLSSEAATQFLAKYFPMINKKP